MAKRHTSEFLGVIDASIIDTIGGSVRCPSMRSIAAKKSSRLAEVKKLTGYVEDPVRNTSYYDAPVT